MTRRDFLGLCASIAAAAGLSQLAIPRIAHALEESVIGAKRGSVPGHLDRGCLLHWLHRVVRPDRDPGCGDYRSRSYLPELLGDPLCSRWSFHGGGQGADHRRRQLHPCVRGRGAEGVRGQRPARGRRGGHHRPGGGRQERQCRCGLGLVRRATAVGAQRTPIRRRPWACSST